MSETTKAMKAMKLRWTFKTTPRNGKYHHIVIEDHGDKGFMAQLTVAFNQDPNDLRSETLVLDCYTTIEEACDAVYYPYDIAGLPVLK